MATARKYKLTMFGATGFTGGLCADYLADNLPEKTSWAIAGRNKMKLAAVIERLQQRGAKNLPDIIQADISDENSLDQMAKTSKVVITTVGPYVWYGEPLVKACVTHGTHYCDLTGEPEFVNNMISRYHVEAEKNGAAIVNCCGFDSIPHDAGALFTIRALEKANGGPLTDEASVEGVVSANGTFSGGTWQSAITAFGRPTENRAAMRHAKFVLDDHYPKNARLGAMTPRKDDGFGGWIAPLPTIDPFIVLRSGRALNYAPSFRYSHFAKTGSLIKLVAGMGGVGSLLVAAQIKFLREKLLSYRQSGEGPSESTRSKSWFKVHFRGSANGHTVETEVAGGDPGYSETAKMLAETAMGMALDRGMPKHKGVITPVMALEDKLIKRLEKADITFSVVKVS